MKSAIVFGSSGFVGSHLLSGLLNSSDYGQVTAVARRSLNITHPKLKTVIADYDSLIANYKSLADYNCSKDVKAEVKEGVKSEIGPVADVKDGAKAEMAGEFDRLMGYWSMQSLEVEWMVVLGA